MSQTASPLWIGPATPEERPQAIWLVLRHLAEGQPISPDELIDASGLSPDAIQAGLLAARRDGRFVGAGFSQIQPGKLAMVWIPRTVEGEPIETAAHLLQATCDHLGRHDVQMGQCLLKSPSSNDIAVLRSAGFEYLGNLFYLVCLESDFPKAPPETPLVFEPYTAANHARLTAVVSATYHETLDCPRLNGLRGIDDVVAGYRAAGEFDPSRWLIVTHEGRDVGCLLLTDYPDQENWELMYMGLVAEARGNGWGGHIARYAQWQAGRAGRPRLVLAVDAANRPAIEMYAQANFRAWDHRAVFIRVLAAC